MVVWRDRITQMQYIPFKDLSIYFGITNVYVRFKFSYLSSKKEIEFSESVAALMDSNLTFQSALSCMKMEHVFPHRIVETTYLTDFKEKKKEEKKNKKYNLTQLEMF